MYICKIHIHAVVFSTSQKQLNKKKKYKQQCKLNSFLLDYGQVLGNCFEWFVLKQTHWKCPKSNSYGSLEIIRLQLAGDNWRQFLLIPRKRMIRTSRWKKSPKTPNLWWNSEGRFHVRTGFGWCLLGREYPEALGRHCCLQGPGSMIRKLCEFFVKSVWSKNDKKSFFHQLHSRYQR